MKELPDDFVYLPEMYYGSYYPKFLVDKLRDLIKETAADIATDGRSTDDIQFELDCMTRKINDMQDEFCDNGSEIETVARESIADTVDRILKALAIDIEIEEAIRERDW